MIDIDQGRLNLSKTEKKYRGTSAADKHGV
jgi:hypothetical protein